MVREANLDADEAPQATSEADRMVPKAMLDADEATASKSAQETAVIVLRCIIAPFLTATISTFNAPATTWTWAQNASASRKDGDLHLRRRGCGRRRTPRTPAW